MRCLEPSVYLGVKLDLVTGAVCVGPWWCALLVKALGCLNIIILCIKSPYVTWESARYGVGYCPRSTEATIFYSVKICFFGFRQFTLSPGPTFTIYYIKQIAMLRCGLLEKWESGARLTRTCEGCQGKRDNSNAAARHTDALSKLLQ